MSTAVLLDDISCENSVQNQDFQHVVEIVPDATPPPTHEQILDFQAALLPVQKPMNDAKHHFARGMYGREFVLNAGDVVVGKIHKHEHLMFVLKGRAVVVDEFGRYEVEAGFIQVSKPGAKRVVYAFEDTTFFTVHLNPTDTKDLVQIEAEHIVPETEAMRALIAAYKLEAKP